MWRKPETLIIATLAILGFYKGGSLVPALIYLLDPVNSYSQELALGVDWFWRRAPGAGDILHVWI